MWRERVRSERFFFYVVDLGWEMKFVVVMMCLGKSGCVFGWVNEVEVGRGMFGRYSLEV